MRTSLYPNPLFQMSITAQDRARLARAQHPPHLPDKKVVFKLVGPVGLSSVLICQARKRVASFVLICCSKTYGAASALVNEGKGRACCASKLSERRTGSGSVCWRVEGGEGGVVPPCKSCWYDICRQQSNVESVRSGCESTCSLACWSV